MFCFDFDFVSWVWFLTNLTRASGFWMGLGPDQMTFLESAVLVGATGGFSKIQHISACPQKALTLPLSLMPGHYHCMLHVCMPHRKCIVIIDD